MRCLRRMGNSPTGRRENREADDIERYDRGSICFSGTPVNGGSKTKKFPVEAV